MPRNEKKVIAQVKPSTDRDRKRVISQRELLLACEIGKLHEKIISDLKKRIAAGATAEPGPLSPDKIYGQALAVVRKNAYPGSRAPRKRRVAGAA